MKFRLEIGHEERHQIEFSRDAFTGKTTLMVDGVETLVINPLNPLTFFSFSLVKRYEFDIGETEKLKLVIEHERPLLLAGLRSHKYRAYVDGELVKEKEGM